MPRSDNSAKSSLASTGQLTLTCWVVLRWTTTLLVDSSDEFWSACSMSARSDQISNNSDTSHTCSNSQFSLGGVNFLLPNHPYPVAVAMTGAMPRSPLTWLSPLVLLWPLKVWSLSNLLQQNIRANCCITCVGRLTPPHTLFTILADVRRLMVSLDRCLLLLMLVHSLAAHLPCHCQCYSPFYHCRVFQHALWPCWPDSGSDSHYFLSL